MLRLPEGGTAFIDGWRGDHVCNTNGDAVYISQSGKVIHWYTYRQWASYTSGMRERLIYEYHDAIMDPIMQGGATCSICKCAFNPIWDIDI